MPRNVRGSASQNCRVSPNAVIAMARDVRSLQCWSTAPPSQLSSAVGAYGTIAPITLAEAPGTSRSEAIARLPPPVIDSRMCFPEA
jgi:hypothetical protein